ncbi:MAG: pseudouridine synthase [Rhodoferax sp.]|uniref:pseudouridine synthase n=1 Tax=Rhodoferax sp. TaxID=50421 RepID=UPI0027198EB9|nr:pseudouridine synthase [Rhodoferax sp.]MDO8450085.1 pseudouridine synthase [Rhodoferax sp.]
MTANSDDTSAQTKVESLRQPDMPAMVEQAAVSDESGDGESSKPGLAPKPPQEGKKKPESATTGIRFDDVVSGQFDADEEIEDLVPVKRVLAPLAETPKLHKVLAQAGMGSRLEMEQLIMEGRITVNNEPAHIGQRIQFGDHVKVNGKPIRFRIEAPPARVIAYHKPVGEVVTHDDPQNRPTVFRRLPKLFQGKWQSVGRLDLNTEGLLLFTSSGELANNLMHPRFGLEREYAVRVLGALSKDEKHKLLDGVKLDDGMAQFGSIEEGGGEGSNCWYRVTISEGRNREVRRMFEAVGHAVSRLIRIRYGAMVLPRGLKRGAWMELDEGDIRSLMQAAGTGTSRARGEEGGQVEPDGSRRDGPGQKPGPRNRSRGVRGNGPRSSGTGQRNAAAGGGKDMGQGVPSGSGQGRNSRSEPGDRQGGAGQPDPMKTAFGYIGADSFTRQRQDQGQRRGGSGGGGSGGGQRRGGRGR